MSATRKPTGVRVLTTKRDDKVVFYLYPTAKSGTKQNSKHTIIQGVEECIVTTSKRSPDPKKIGDAVLSVLGL